jgi:hypothetical protein
MTELELTRSRDDRRRYELEGVGGLHLGGLFSRSATAEAGGSTWSFARRGFFSTTMEATDAAGEVVGSFKARAIKRGGPLEWRGRELVLRPASVWKERYALADGDRELALFDGRSWGKRPVRVSLEDPGAVEPGLLLFCAYVVRGLAEDADAAAGASAATTTSATS